MYLVTAGQMQNIDRKTIESFGISGQVLMENAGRGAFDMMMEHFPEIHKWRVCILAGRGNNGGDGFVIARYLMNKGINTTTFILGERGRISGDARHNLELLDKIANATKEEKSANTTEKDTLTHKGNKMRESDTLHKLPSQKVNEIPDIESFNQLKNRIVHHDLFIDGILGTGLNSNVRGVYKEVIDTVNNLGKPVFSIDIPSGLNADTGKPMGSCIKASFTATFAFAKIGHMLHPGKELSGRLNVIDIGIPAFMAEKESISTHLIDKDMIRPLFPPRPYDAHKGTFGHLFVIAGSAGKTGAAALACNSAMACGAGLVTLGIPESINSTMEPQVTETMTLPLPDSSEFKGSLAASALEKIILHAKGNGNEKAKTALAIGPGLGLNSDTIQLVKSIITEPIINDIPLIIDADGLNAIATDDFNTLTLLKKRKIPAILTPHPGEMARLTGKTSSEIQADRLGSAKSFADEFHVIVVLKGAGTVIAMPDKSIYLCPTGNPGMASGGMGDTLTGMIAGFLAQGFSAKNASVAGVYIHGLCGDRLAKRRGAFGFTASDIINILPETIFNFLRE
ncbi:conserved hypothetical protein [Desulfamplus magnetovallimortis]|uniref:Bifunctional NAD(P)H-hydrate repair enzyme n=1 Tax=Desulfamplus magnetovallimortis TaxID=1246637 RepID=A0A1W1H5U3_9BACT|nr:NAD(P)H-hydrate dehydratase [Desulfamplus magnetovallimortis]SLM27738.1 conserved hypothetical protein [Desulfamplus magnetovallimortis]